jgi:hypothetical protein
MRNQTFHQARGQVQLGEAQGVGRRIDPGEQPIATGLGGRLALGQEHIVRGSGQHLADPNAGRQVRLALFDRIVAARALAQS